jgi:hypothetical protein
LVIEPGDFLRLLFVHDVVPLLVSDLNMHNVAAAVKSSKKSILSGKGLLHVLSKRTVFEKETVNNASKYRFVKNKIKSCDTNKQYGEGGVVFFETSSNVYLNVNQSAPQITIYSSSTTKKALSNKVKDNKALTFNKSYTGFLCPMFTSESKNIGRIVCLCKDVHISNHQTLPSIPYDYLNVCNGSPQVNVSKSFNNGTIHMLMHNNTPHLLSIVKFIELKRNIYRIKKAFKFIEIYIDDVDFDGVCKVNIIFISHGPQMLFKHLKVENMYVTPNDFEFWLQHEHKNKSMEEIINEKSWDFVTSWWSLFIPLSAHNLAQKNLLFLNNLRNAITATDNKLCKLFCDPSSTYQTLTSKHFPIFKPKNKLSEAYQIYLPRLTMLVSWFAGYNQEDCMVVNASCALCKTCFMYKHVVLRLEIEGKIPNCNLPHLDTIPRFQETKGRC